MVELFLTRNTVILILECVLFFLWLPLRFSLNHTFWTLCMVCFGIIFFILLMLGVHWNWKISIFIVLSNLEKFQPLFIQTFFSSCLICLVRTQLSWSYPTTHWHSVHLLKLFSFLVSFWMIYVGMSSSSLIFSSAIFNLPLISSCVLLISDIMVFTFRVYCVPTQLCTYGIVINTNLINFC